MIGFLSDGGVMLCFLYSLEISHNELSFVLIVTKYLNIFEEETGLPPHRGIEFHIDLVKAFEVYDN